jgi:hypothetical protein
MPQNILDLQIFECSSCPDPVLKIVKIEQSRIENQMVQFFRLVKFNHQQDFHDDLIRIGRTG